MTLSEKIASLKAGRRITSEELAESAGVPLGTLNKILNGETKNPTGKTLAKIAGALGCTVEYLYGDNIDYAFDLLPVRRKRVRLLGSIAAGEPIYAEEDHESYVLAAGDIHCDFALRACGDSMVNARIYDGDIVFIREQPDVDDGEIAAVIIDDSATLKRVYKTSDGVMLASENSKYRPMHFSPENSNVIRILGKAVAFQSEL